MRRIVACVFGTMLLTTALAACGTPAQQASAPAEPTSAPAAATPTTEVMVDATTEVMIDPTTAPTVQATAAPTVQATAAPTVQATTAPTVQATTAPVAEATAAPTVQATAAPIAEATAAPVVQATAAPVVQATAAPIAEATAAPVVQATAAPVAALPAWQTTEFIDARTGAAFTLGSFAGKTVYVEPMATWCSNCKKQLINAQAAKQQLGDQVVFVALSVESDLASTDLANYAADNGFDARFAVATPAALQALVDKFGRTITNPPSTPHFIIRPDGTVSELMTGFADAETLVRMLAEAQGG
ncbi:MAG: hypothetical protein H7Z42_06915 [Roseiflexaceae bacterium]|nr:hypothetical protein [Roseiflexaceae bacterium]